MAGSGSLMGPLPAKSGSTPRRSSSRIPVLQVVQPTPKPISALVPLGRLVAPRVRVLLESLESARGHAG
jgi:hypothetical protein